MLGLNGLGGSAPPALRQPVCELQFGGASAGGGIDGLAGTVGSALGIDLGGADAWQDHLVSLRLEAGLAPFVDVVEIMLANSAQAPAVAVGDQGTVALGYGDETANPVFTGRVERLRHQLGATSFTATNGGAQLARLRLNQSYEQQNAGKLVEALAAAAGVETDTVEDGVDFPFYVFDDGSTLYQQVAKVARLSNYAAWFSAEGKLNFAPLDEGDPVATFSYGGNILALQVEEAGATLGEVTAIGEGAAGSQGADAWSWLVKDPSAVTGNAGSGAPKRLLSEAGLRSGDAAQRAADGASGAAGRLLVTGTLLALGTPAVLPGSTITIANARQAIANGNFLVQRVRHHYSKTEGFTTFVAFILSSV